MFLIGRVEFNATRLGRGRDRGSRGESLGEAGKETWGKKLVGTGKEDEEDGEMLLACEGIAQAFLCFARLLLFLLSGLLGALSVLLSLLVSCISILEFPGS